MRARNIKPGFFCNEELVELSPVTRLFFIGLWCFADREGRFEARPTKIKMAIFPAESHDIPAMLADLTRTGFLHFYEVNGSKFYQINNFSRHQRPHKNEQASTIPPMNEASTTLVVPEHNLGTSRDALNEECGMRIEECGKRKDAQPHKPRPQAVAGDGRYDDPDFLALWESYPNKSGKFKAFKAWQSLKPDTITRQSIDDAIFWQRKTPKWTKDKGEFIPMLSTYLNQRMWEDEPTRPAGPAQTQNGKPPVPQMDDMAKAIARQLERERLIREEQAEEARKVAEQGDLAL